MPSRKSRSRSRSPHKRHKKSHKKSKRTRSKSRNSPASPVNSLKFEEKSNSNDSNNSNGIYKPKLPSVMLPPAFLAKLEPKEEPKQLERNEPASGMWLEKITRVSVWKVLYSCFLCCFSVYQYSSRNIVTIVKYKSGCNQWTARKKTEKSLDWRWKWKSFLTEYANDNINDGYDWRTTKNLSTWV